MLFPEKVIPMKYPLLLAACLLLLSCSLTKAQTSDGRGKSDGPRRGPAPMDIEDNPQGVGEAGVAWYTTWETGLAEAKRSNRPIFFMSAATTCSGVPGVF